MHPHEKVDLEEFYNLVAVSDTVELIGQRNEETASLFGNADSTTAQQPIVLAQSAPSRAAAAARECGLPASLPANASSRSLRKAR